MGGFFGLVGWVFVWNQIEHTDHRITLDKLIYFLEVVPQTPRTIVPARFLAAFSKVTKR